MKKIFYLIAVCAAVAACGNGQKKAKVEENVKTEAEVMAENLVKLQLDSIASEIGKLQPVSIVSAVRDGKVVLTADEKKNVPEYLCPADAAKNLQTLSQKYRAIAVLGVDREIAAMYDQPVAAYDEALSALYVDVNDPAVKAFNEVGNVKDAIQASYASAKENGREYFFWETATAAVVEQSYVASTNMDKFLTAFDDKGAADFTLQLVYLTDAIEKLATVNDEYAKLDASLKPLKALNAINVEQFCQQIESVKGDIAAAREGLLK